jgi:low affinity Fe/Cu permease
MKEKIEKMRPSVSERFATSVTKATGSTTAFIVAFILVIVWGATGPIFHYSENWQLVINTGTTIITFLMVFLIQKAQNKDSLAIQLKLNELVAAHEFASNRLVNVENLSEEELLVIQKYYSRIGQITKKDKSLQQSHSIDEANEQSEIKKEREEDIKDHLKERKETKK